jgi:hypothetical protein
MPSPLSHHVSHFHVGKTSVLNALLWLGYDNQVCFGIEYSGLELNNVIQVDENETTVGKAVRKILGPAYQISVSDGVILVRKTGAPTPDWLIHRLRNFKTGRVELLNADDLLFMALETDLDKAKHGFGGSWPVTEPRDEVGPIIGRAKTVQELLIGLVATSRGASWFPTNPLLVTSFPSSVNQFWTMATYSSPNLYRPQ